MEIYKNEQKTKSVENHLTKLAFRHTSWNTLEIIRQNPRNSLKIYETAEIRRTSIHENQRTS